MPVAVASIEELGAVGFVDVPAIELAQFTIRRHAVTLDVAEMGACRAKIATLQLGDASLDDDTPLPSGIKARAGECSECGAPAEMGTVEAAIARTADVASGLGRPHDAVDVAVKACTGLPADAAELGRETVGHGNLARTSWHQMGCTSFFAFSIQDGVKEMWRIQGDDATLAPRGSSLALEVWFPIKDFRSP